MPSPNRSRPPAFHELDADTFEELTCALYEKESGIKSADLYRTKHKPQYGIDIKAERHDGAVEVASCKCVKRIEKGDIDDWSTDFLKHWDTHWNGQGVQRFVLVAAVPVNSKERDDDIQRQRERFRTIGVSYDVWAPRQLQEKLRPHPGIVSQYLGENFVPRLCGMRTDNVAAATPSTGALSQFVVSQISSLQAALSDEVEKQLDVAIDGLRRGDLQQVAEQMADIRTGPNWSQLRATTQARIVRLQGALSLKYGDLDGAERFSDEADAIARPDEARLRSLIASRRAGAEEGLRVLGNPSTLDGVQLKLAMLLDARREEEAKTLLESHPALKVPNAETERLRALIELFRDRRSDALIAIQRAEQMEPSWPAIRRAGAIVRYALALSPLATTQYYLGLNPIDLDLVREDDEARRLLLEALARFESLAADDVDPEIHAQDDAWALACLSNLRDHLNVAEARCRSILSTSPTHGLVVMWALARGFDIDRTTSINALHELIEQGKADAQQVLVLAWLLAAEDRVGDAKNVLQEMASLFESPQAQIVRDQWLTEFSYRDTAASMAETPTQELSSLEFLRLIEQAQQTSNWSLVEKSFHEMMTQVKQPDFALFVARALAAAQRWNAIAQHIEALLLFATKEAVRIAVYTASQTGQSKLALNILEEYRSVFPSGMLPNDLRAIEVEALQNIGDPAAALRRATMLAAESRELPAQMVKAKVHLRTGNIRAALPTIRQAMQASQLSSDNALGLARIIAIEDKELAQQLWRYANTAGLTNDLAIPALEQAFGFGIEHEAKQLLGTMEQLAQQGTGAIRIANIDEVIEYVQRAKEDAANLQRLYFDGVVPVHLINGRCNINLAKLYSLFSLNEQALMTSPIMLRHAAKPITNSVATPITDWQLHLDITALLLASQLGLLDCLEQLPHPIALSASVPSALQELEIDARPHQPHYIAAMRKILAAIQRGTISIVELTNEQSVNDSNADEIQKALKAVVDVEENTVFIAHHLPDTREPIAQRFTTLRSIVEGVYLAGALDTASYKDSLARIGNYALDLDGTPPTPGVVLIFLDNTFSVLAAAGLLDAIVSIYRVVIDGMLQSIASNEVSNADYDDAVADMIGALRKRIAEGLEGGRYKLFHSSVEENLEVSNTGPLAAAIAQCLIDSIHAPYLPGAVMWVDDRHINGYQNNSQGIQLIGVTDVIYALRRAKLVSEDKYFEALLSLRASGAMFIPLELEEVCYHLQHAPIIDGSVVETPSLATLRRYVARTLLLETHLKIGDSPAGLEGRPDEALFLVALNRLAEKSIILQWRIENITDEARRARSVWIWNSLRVDRFLHQALVATDFDRAPQLAALQICGLLTSAIEISSSRSVRTMLRRKAFFRWVDDYTLGCRLDDDSILAEQVTQFLISLLLKYFIQSSPKEKYGERLKKRLVRTLLLQYPPTILNRLSANTDFCRYLNLPVTSTISIANKTFAAHHFWRAVRKALTYGKSSVRTLKNHRRVIVRAVRGQEHSVCFNGKRAVLTDPALAILDRSIVCRRAALEKHIDWFDMPLVNRKEAILEISKIHDTTKRINALDKFRRRSVAEYYRKMHNRLGKTTRHQFQEFMPPAAGALLDHLRLPSDNSLSMTDRLIIAADALIADYDIIETFIRLASLPIPLPQPIIKRFQSMTTTELNLALTTICESASTPLQLLHSLFLLRRVTENNKELFNATAGHLLDSWRKIAPLFITVLKWTNTAYTHDADWGALPATERLLLVWVHADRLTHILLKMGFDIDRVARDFEDNHPQLKVHEYLRLDSLYHGAAATPDSINQTCLLFHGLAYVCNGTVGDMVFSEAQANAIFSLLTVEVNDEKAVLPWLLVNREAANNELGSFFTYRIKGLSALDASPGSVSRAIDTVLHDLEADPISVTAWPVICALSNPALSPTESMRLLAVIDKLDMLAFVNRDPNDIVLCRIVIDCWRRIGRPEDHQKIAVQLERLGLYLASQNPGSISDFSLLPSNSVVRHSLINLLEAAALSSRANDSSEAFAQLGDMLVRLATVWPASAPFFRSFLNNVVLQRPALNTPAVWKSLLKLRVF